MRKPLHYLVWRGNMDLRWSWWRVEDKYHYEFPLLCYALLLNLAFRVWIYSARISEVWKHNVDKNLICLSSCLLVNMVVLEYEMKEMENRNKWYVNQELWRYRKRTRTSSRGDDGPNCDPHGLSPPLLGAPEVSTLKYWKLCVFWWL